MTPAEVVGWSDWQTGSREVSFAELQRIQTAQAVNDAGNPLQMANVIVATTNIPKKDSLTIFGMAILIDILNLSQMHILRQLNVALSTAAELPQLASMVEAVKGWVEVDAVRIQHFGQGSDA